jgi:hypothetical protein
LMFRGGFGALRIDITCEGRKAEIPAISLSKPAISRY